MVQLFVKANLNPNQSLCRKRQVAWPYYIEVTRIENRLAVGRPSTFGHNFPAFAMVSRGVVYGIYDILCYMRKSNQQEEPLTDTFEVSQEGSKGGSPRKRIVRKVPCTVYQAGSWIQAGIGKVFREPPIGER